MGRGDFGISAEKDSSGGTLAALFAEVCASAACAEVDAVTPACSGGWLAARSINTGDIHFGKRAFSHVLRAISAFAGVAVRMAIGKNRGFAAGYTGRNGHPRS